MNYYMPSAPVVIEIPFGAFRDDNEAANYSYACVLDSVGRGEFPLVNIVPCRDGSALVRADQAWGRHASKWVVYDDYGVTEIVQQGVECAERLGIPIEYRKIKDELG